MRKIYFASAFLIGVITSCEGKEEKGSDKENDDSTNVDLKMAAIEFCECAEMEGDDQTACHDEWVENYKNARGGEEEAKQLLEKMQECDPANGASVLMRLAE